MKKIFGKGGLNMATQKCLFRTSNRDSARLFKDAVKAFNVEISSETKENGDFYCELITVIDNSHSMQRDANIRAYATAYKMELLKINDVFVESD